ncbi:MAG: DUF2179 domain-containing protein [Peptostreptococcaceae bacterium]|nr:DUF2179 domain-containing protein [Peptostreptococcaceae bacterium]
MYTLILIIAIQLLYVPMLTLRTISMVKNLKLFTALFGFLETLMYIFGLAIVLSGEKSILEMIVYAAGFSMGLVVGIYIEQKLAIGYLCLNVNINQSNEEMVSVLRVQGYGVTVYEGEGKNGKRKSLEILTKRKCENDLIKLIHFYEPAAFIVAYEPKTFKGGYLTTIMKKQTNIKLVGKKIIDANSNNRGFLKKSILEIKKESKELGKNWK